MKVNLKDIDWIVKNFDSLNKKELYDMMHLRQLVFVEEQNCPYIDADFKDQKSLLINAYLNQELLAHCRLVFPKISYQEASIGRVCTHPKTRGTGLGKALMHKSIEVLESTFGSSCRISAQTYLIPFYSQFGFKISSEEYLEDNLPHIQMLRK